MFETDVWDRTGRSTLSKPVYGVLLSTFTALGIIFCLACSMVTRNVDMAAWPWWMWVIAIVGLLGCCFAGSVLASSSDNPALSIIGFALVAGPMGLFIGPLVGQYSADTVLIVGIQTTLLVVVLGVVGGLIRKDLSGWGNWLLGLLVLLILGTLSVPLMGLLGLSVEGSMVFWTWAGILLFGVMVIYDVNRAMRVPRTVDNAIDCAVALFLNWVNLFIRLLILRDS